MNAGPARESKPRRSRAGGVPREIRAVDPGSWDTDAIVAAMQDWARVAGGPPRAHEWSATATGPGSGSARWRSEHPRWPSAGTVVHHFGSWTAGLQAAGLPVSTVKHDLPLAERVATATALRAAGEPVRAIAEHLGVDLRTAYRYLAATVCRGCGGPALFGVHCRACLPRARPAFGRDEIIEALQTWTAEHGTPPRQPDWSNRSTAWREGWPRWPGASTVDRVFGSWNSALETAGLPTRRYAWAHDEALAAITAWARQHGRAPAHADARAEPALPDQGACERLFGSWSDALRAAGLSPGWTSWDDERIQTAVQAWADWQRQHGTGDPSAASYRAWAAAQRDAVPSASSLRRRFGGSWNAVRASAGLNVSRAGRPRRAR